MDTINTTGFPSPAQGYEKETFDFNRILIKQAAEHSVQRILGERELYSIDENFVYLPAWQNIEYTEIAHDHYHKHAALYV
jgi:hypothetical protein